MNIKELKRLIKDLPDNLSVVMSTDEEGNCYNKLEGYSIDLFEANERMIYDDDDVADGSVKESDLIQCLTLWP